MKGLNNRESGVGAPKLSKSMRLDIVNSKKISIGVLIFYFLAHWAASQYVARSPATHWLSAQIFYARLLLQAQHLPIGENRQR
jgi:hypothetical protein